MDRDLEARIPDCNRNINPTHEELSIICDNILLKKVKDFISTHDNSKKSTRVTLTPVHNWAIYYIKGTPHFLEMPMDSLVMQDEQLNCS